MSVQWGWQTRCTQFKSLSSINASRNREIYHCWYSFEVGDQEDLFDDSGFVFDATMLTSFFGGCKEMLLKQGGFPRYKDHQTSSNTVNQRAIYWVILKYVYVLVRYGTDMQKLIFLSFHSFLLSSIGNWKVTLILFSTLWPLIPYFPWQIKDLSNNKIRKKAECYSIYYKVACNYQKKNSFIMMHLSKLYNHKKNRWDWGRKSNIFTHPCLVLSCQL